MKRVLITLAILSVLSFSTQATELFFESTSGNVVRTQTTSINPTERKDPYGFKDLHYKQGLYHYSFGRKEEAYKWFERSAAKGKTEAFFSLAHIQYYDLLDEKNLIKSIALFEKATGEKLTFNNQDIIIDGDVNKNIKTDDFLPDYQRELRKNVQILSNLDLAKRAKDIETRRNVEGNTLVTVENIPLGVYHTVALIHAVRSIIKMAIGNFAYKVKVFLSLELGKDEILKYEILPALNSIVEEKTAPPTFSFYDSFLYLKEFTANLFYCNNFLCGYKSKKLKTV